MTRQDLIDAISVRAGINKRQASEAVEGILESIAKTLKKGGKVTLVGFGNFSVVKKKARTGRNPQTGKAIQIPARKAPKFNASKQLKDILN